MSDEVYTSPIIFMPGRVKRGGVVYRGNIMLPGTAARIAEYRSKIRHYADAGVCMAETARKLGWSVGTIRTWSNILGIQFKKHRRRRVYRHNKFGWEEAIREGAAKGETLEQIAMRLDVLLVNIHRYCVDNGINWKELKRLSKEHREHAQAN